MARTDLPGEVVVTWSDDLLDGENYLVIHEEIGGAAEVGKVKLVGIYRLQEVVEVTAETIVRERRVTR